MHLYRRLVVVSLLEGLRPQRRTEPPQAVTEGHAYIRARLASEKAYQFSRSCLHPPGPLGLTPPHPLPSGHKFLPLCTRSGGVRNSAGVVTLRSRWEPVLAWPRGGLRQGGGSEGSRGRVVGDGVGGGRPGGGGESAAGSGEESRGGPDRPQELEEGSRDEKRRAERDSPRETQRDRGHIRTAEIPPWMEGGAGTQGAGGSGGSGRQWIHPRGWKGAQAAGRRRQVAGCR